jgi:hypothetical protein
MRNLCFHPEQHCRRHDDPNAADSSVDFVASDLGNDEGYYYNSGCEQT